MTTPRIPPHRPALNDAELIDRVELIATLGEASVRFPTLRLGQLIDNAVPTGRDLFYMTDAELAEAIRAYKGGRA